MCDFGLSSSVRYHIFLLFAMLIFFIKIFNICPNNLIEHLFILILHYVKFYSEFIIYEKCIYRILSNPKNNFICIEKCF